VLVIVIPMRVTLIHNPGAGEEDHEGETLRSLVAAAGHEVLYCSTHEPGWERALEQPSELVVVAGGDGTVGNVFKEVATKDVAVTLLPLGSANNVARTLGLGDAGVEELVRGWSTAKRRRFDVAYATAPWGEDLFVESMGGGIFGDVLTRAENVDAGRKPDGEEKVDLGLELLRDAVESARPRHWEVTVDGSDLSGEFLAVEVTNIRELGPNLPIAPGADAGDGLLDVVLVGAEDRPLLASYLDERLRDLEPPAPRLPVRTGARVVLRPPDDCPLHVDDELWPQDPDARGDATAVATVGTVLTLLVPS
jgi:diacylglycerol kinase family enzyme